VKESIKTFLHDNIITTKRKKNMTIQ